ncbi:hypothetical protein FSP39_000509 [Pinctada imbricata]|uniref:Guanylate cyclase n=1 Tax=Pinctada imbricata TaxID=66713 RepID=A0AA89BN46_PINIB|nr:hypothetical protein FSP39_000509 [Pinctada imbricata]
MIFIHDSEIQFHGNLKSSNCLVDSRWVLQVSDFGLQQLVSKDGASKNNVEKNYKGMLWRAPELLRSRSVNVYGTQKGDIYSFGIIMYEILGRKGPWGDIEYSPKEIVHRVSYCVSDFPFRPELSKIQCEDYLKQCIESCWNEHPEQRPDFKYIRYRLKPLQQGLKSNIFDNMLAIMEKYANNLEALVAERTEQLSDEKKMTENLLYRMLPRPVANKLKRGHFVEPETYECVIDMLNELYTCFDSIIGHFDVYKVETIGDCLPSGPCVAGVVGLRMPRYTLFGDSVNTASRMETNGVPLKIHCSSTFKTILDKLGGYLLSERGYIAMKGKGEQFTYFLEGEDEGYRLRRMNEWRATINDQLLMAQSDERCNNIGISYSEHCDKVHLSPNCWGGCNGVDRNLSLTTNEESQTLDIPGSLTDDTLSTLSSHSDYKQNLENVEQFVSFSSGSALCKMCDAVPLMTKRKENYAFIGSDGEEDEKV